MAEKGDAGSASNAILIIGGEMNKWTNVNVAAGIGRHPDLDLKLRKSHLPIKYLGEGG